jgi:hypothetical protein
MPQRRCGLRNRRSELIDVRGTPEPISSPIPLPLILSQYMLMLEQSWALPVTIAIEYMEAIVPKLLLQRSYKAGRLPLNQ